MVIQCIYTFLSLFLQDYVDVESPKLLVKDEAEYHEAKSRQAASVTLEDQNPIWVNLPKCIGSSNILNSYCMCIQNNAHLFRMHISVRRSAVWKIGTVRWLHINNTTESKNKYSWKVVWCHKGGTNYVLLCSCLAM